MPLKAADADFMLRALPLEGPLRGRLEDFRRLGLPLSDDDKNDLRDLVADQLMTQGFDQEYRLTPIGRRFEELIDLLFVGRDPSP
jgi:hypothetical protein